MASFAPCKGTRILEISGKFSLVESGIHQTFAVKSWTLKCGIQLMESRILLTTGIWIQFPLTKKLSKIQYLQNQIQDSCYDIIVLFFASYASCNTILCNPDLVVQCGLFGRSQIKSLLMFELVCCPSSIITTQSWIPLHEATSSQCSADMLTSVYICT